MLVGSLFSGIGGFDLGLERAGHATAWQVEIDKDCQRVLRRRFVGPTERDQQGEPDDGATGGGTDASRRGPVHFADITRIERGQLAPVDLVCGGFPCQDLSVAGKRAGLAGERSGLWHEFRRVVAELTPRWVLVENVPGLLSSNGGADFAVVLRGLVELGYGVAWRILDAQYFGVAQRRRRVFVVGCLGSPARAAALLFEPESCDGDTPPSRSTREGPAASLTSGSGVGSNDPGRRREDDVNLVPELAATLRSASDGASHGKVNGTDRMTFVPDTSYALAARNAKGVSLLESQDTFIAHTLRSEGGDASEDGTGRGTPLVVQGGAQQDQFVSPDGVVPTLAHASNTHDGHYQPKVMLSGMAVRRLTPTECERLQGFPDGWTAGQSDSVRYRQLGNAVCVPVAEWIGRRMA